MPEEEEDEITAPFDTQELQAGWAGKVPARPRCHAYLALGAKTDLGRVRENNEDKFDFLEPDDAAVLGTKGRVYAVADGMGGHSAGQIASELALNVFIRSYYADGNPDVPASLERAVREANAYVVDVARTVPGRNGMGATLTAVVVRDDDIYVAQVGDSRCYLLREGRFDQVTEDHSWVAEQVRAGSMTLQEAEASPFRNVITRSMGGAPEVEPDVSAVKIQPGDRFLLCSDGLSGMVSDEEMAELLSQGTPSVSVWNLIDRANQYGGKDNVTALVLDVYDIHPWPEDEGAAAGDTESTESLSMNGGGDEASGSTPESRPAPGSTGKPGFIGRLFGKP